MIPPVWRKSSRSANGTSGQCVELADLGSAIGIRDSKSPDAGHLTISPETFADLLSRIRRETINPV
jgi:hypothetical protein